jgi:hypothetical protein
MPHGSSTGAGAPPSSNWGWQATVAPPALPRNSGHSKPGHQRLVGATAGVQRF